MEGVWSDSKTFKLINCSNSMIVNMMYSQNDYRDRTRKKAVIKEIAHVLDITGAYKFEW